MTRKTTKLEGKEAEKAEDRKQICYLYIHKVILVTINSSFAKLSVFATKVCSPQGNNCKCFQERIFWVFSSRNTLSIRVEMTSFHQEIRTRKKQMMNTSTTFKIPQRIIRLKSKSAWLTSCWLPLKTGWCYIIWTLISVLVTENQLTVPVFKVG